MFRLPVGRRVSTPDRVVETSRETYLSTQQPQASPQAWVSGPQSHGRWSGRTQIPAGQGSSPTECVIGSVNRRHTFSEFRRRGRRVRQGAVRVTYLAPTGASIDAPDTGGATPPPYELDHVEVAFALGRRYGTAVERNRARRRLRDAFTTAWAQYRAQHTPTDDDGERPEPIPAPDPVTGAFLLTGSRRVLTAPFADLVANLLGCLRQLTPASPDSASQSWRTPRRSGPVHPRAANPHLAGEPA